MYKDSVFKHFDFILINILCITIAFLLANLAYLGSLNYYSTTIFTNVLIIIILPVCLIDIINNPYSGILRRNNIDEIRILIKYTIYYFIFTIFLLYVLKLSSVYSRIVVVLTYSIFLALSFATRILWKKLIISETVTFTSIKQKSLLIVSKYDDINNILENINKEEYKQYDIKGLCIVDKSLKGRKIDEYKVICNKNEVLETVFENSIEEIYIFGKSNSLSPSVMKKLIKNGVAIHLDINSIFGIEPDSEVVNNVGIYKTLELGKHYFTTRQQIYFVFKRIFDVIFSLICMIPLLVLIVIVKFSYLLNGDSNSIFYKQIRIGKDGSTFNIYKFRTMNIEADKELIELLKNKKNKKEWDTYHKLVNDPRITKIGNLLRKTSLDEFPQFVNVLKGDMSLIGPRPLVIGELEHHKGLKLYQKMKPGITGWWACNGRSNISYEERLELEYYYVKNCSFSLDLLIVLRTIICIFKKTGAE